MATTRKKRRGLDHNFSTKHEITQEKSFLYPWIGRTGFSEGGMGVKKCGLYAGIYGSSKVMIQSHFFQAVATLALSGIVNLLLLF